MANETPPKQRSVADLFGSLPWWVTIPLAVGGWWLSSYPPGWLTTFAPFIGYGAMIVAVAGFVLHTTRFVRGGAKVDAQDWLTLGLVGALIFGLVALGAVVWQRFHFVPVAASGQTSTGGGVSSAQRDSDVQWTTDAHLTLTFDGQLSAATATNQDGVRYYYWYAFPGLAINWDTRQVAGTPGYIVIFLSLNDPTYTNYSKVTVVGGGLLCEVLSASSAGAVVRVMGDMSGRTVDIRFSQKPIPLD